MEVDRSRSTKRKRGNLPKHVTDVLRQWFEEHESHPYPTEEEKQMLIHRTGLLMSQISNWFINARRRRVPNTSCRRD
ncbi:Homeodomain-like protein [Ascobolus immersus RN42]|uniref:Homeodomain-like protein n=1 Tax=Ascobolus immersus RN42 TaxID=1160509 RepID=A0A3N4HYM4_ASCIM|nr:Homeodomain-like protein [Ascobolus immersus RN42]